MLEKKKFWFEWRVSIYGINKNLFFIDDEVYMATMSDLEEYVLNDQGVLFQGSASHVSPFRWYFGQVWNSSHIIYKTMFSDRQLSVQRLDWCVEYVQS